MRLIESSGMPMDLSMSRSLSYWLLFFDEYDFRLDEPIEENVLKIDLNDDIVQKYLFFFFGESAQKETVSYSIS